MRNPGAFEADSRTHHGEGRRFVAKLQGGIHSLVMRKACIPAGWRRQFV
jgi:hypothetical protein